MKDEKKPKQGFAKQKGENLSKTKSDKNTIGKPKKTFEK